MDVIMARMSAKYQVVIPRQVREALALAPHGEILFILDGDKVILRPRPASFTQAMRGLYKEVWPQDIDAWLEEERASWEE